jgi:hypothetical protein
MASDGVIMCGREASGSDRAGMLGDTMSWSFCSVLAQWRRVARKDPEKITHLAYDQKQTFFNMFVANISTSVSGRKLCTAPKYPTRF